ncbi:DUF4259 domain-containing protein [Planosporangium thailandense]|uniref:DUF4259 domain-containing protein n=1 Tax=Planosporangium thailandense TaxID=765197 RepID=A0ABX0Y4P6_9ACTN|nr:DUF4259 domain-containing protein [Planosporangium thailandense]NJC73379.1 DUF4259 domain-containing protein [Planosporangium thailandense]
MNVWGTGPFDNDVAEQFATELDDADPDQRVLMLRGSLQAAVDADEAVDAESAFRAFAAATVAAAGCPGAPLIESDYAPEFLTLDDPPKIPPDLPSLARDALERIEEHDSGWYQLWQKADNLREAVETLEVVRDSLC